MVIEQIFDTINLVLNKQRRGFVKTSQKITAVTAAMYDFFRSEAEFYRKTGVLPASLKEFVKPVELVVTDGIANLPTDFAQEVSLETDCGSQGVFLSPEEYYDRLQSSILDPDQANPIAKCINGKLYIAPDEFTTITLTYLRTPSEFTYATTVAGDGRSETFNEAGSVDIEYGMEFSNEIARRALAYLGVAFQNAEAFQLAINDNAK